MSSDSWAAGAPTRCSSIYTPPLSLSCAIMRVRCYQVAPSRSSPTKIVPPFNSHPPALVDYWRTASHQKQATICYSCHASVEREMVLVNFHSTKHTDLPTNPPTNFPKPSASNRRQQRNICGDSHGKYRRMTEESARSCPTEGRKYSHRQPNLDNKQSITFRAKLKDHHAHHVMWSLFTRALASYSKDAYRINRPFCSALHYGCPAPYHRTYTSTSC